MKTASKAELKKQIEDLNVQIRVLRGENQFLQGQIEAFKLRGSIPQIVPITVPGTGQHGPSPIWYGPTTTDPNYQDKGPTVICKTP